VRRLLVVVFFVFFLVIIIIDEVAILPRLAFFFLIVLLVRIIRDEVEMDRMRLRDLEFRLAFGALGPSPPPCSVLYTAIYEVNSRARRGCFERHRAPSSRTYAWLLQESTPKGQWLVSVV
jgi:hypothetical protein